MGSWPRQSRAWRAAGLEAARPASTAIRKARAIARDPKPPRSRFTRTASPHLHGLGGLEGPRPASTTPGTRPAR